MMESSEEKSIEANPNLTKLIEKEKENERDSKGSNRAETTGADAAKPLGSGSADNHYQASSTTSNNNELLPLIPFMLIIGTVLIVLMAIVDTAIIQGQSPQPFRSIAYIDGIILLASLTLLVIVISIYKGKWFAIVGSVLLALAVTIFFAVLKFT